MARTKISEFSATPGNNTDIDGINIAEGCAPSGINDAIRELMSQLKDFQAGTAGDSFNGPVGTTTAAAGAFTTLSASSTVSGTGFSNYLASPPAIGGTAAAAGSFTTLSASSTVTLSGGTANGVLYLNASKVATSGSALTFDGTNLVSGTIQANNAGGFYITNNAASDALQVISRSAGTDNVQFGNTGGGTSAPTAYIWDTRVGGEQMRLTSTGLGVGQSSPAYKLDVNGAIRASGDGSSVGLYLTTSAIRQNTTGGLYIDANASGAAGGIYFRDSSSFTTRLTIDSSGNLGLGVTPSRLIDAQKDQNAATQFRIRNDNNGTGSQSSVSASYGDFAQYITMGQYSPSFTNSGLRAANSSGVFTSGNTNGLRVYTIDSTPLIFGTADTERARIDSSGNLLVGTTSAGAGAVFKVTGTTADAISHQVWSTASSTNAAYWTEGTNSVNGVATGSNAGGTMIRVNKDSGNFRSINAAGTINASGADYAEYMTKAGDFTIAKGDVCGIDINGKLTNVFDDAVSFVVKSTNPSYVGGDSWGAGFDADPDGLEAARQQVDRIAFAGQVPVNVLGATAGQYIIPVNDKGAIKGQAVSNPTFEQYQSAVGKVIAVEADGRARIIVKVS